MIKEILTTVWLLLIFLGAGFLIISSLLNRYEIGEILFRIARPLVISWLIITFLGVFGYTIYLVWS